MSSVISSGISIVSGFFVPTTRLRRQAELATAFRAHATFVFRVLRRLGVEAHALDDMVQEVFVVALRRWARYDPRAPVRPWLYGIARRVAAHHRRRHRRLRGRDRELISTRAGPDEHFDARIASDFIQAFCESLSPPLREVFVCTELEGLTGPEAAKALGLRLNTVYSRSRRARLALQRAIAAHQDKG